MFIKVRDIRNRIEARLAEFAPDVLSGLSPPASNEDIEKAETALRASLPADAKASCRIRNGSETLRFIKGWYLHSLETVIAE